MNVLTYWDYLGIALFTIGLYYGAKIVWVIVGVTLDSYLKKKRFTPRPMNTLDLLESSYNKEVTMREVEKALQDDVEQGLITSYTIGEDFIVYRQKGGRKNLIDLSRYDVE
ncbi:hypothetical protein T36_1284 [Helicobacter cinaedi]|uniref:hypothetical protein n=1 Tax=Helicobacter cinaedi TaxID=213 RepID=UPI001F25A7A5|nr:hypothetical protein [Helicobacter cinaedi]BDB64827.1 hypothetical protein T36_1284 [Helicobacter cinaedi]